jgi:hypothetical protein
MIGRSTSVGEIPPPKKPKPPLPDTPHSFVPKDQQLIFAPKFLKKQEENRVREEALRSIDAEQRKMSGIDKLGWLYDLVIHGVLGRKNRFWYLKQQLYSCLELGKRGSDVYVQILAHELPTQHERWIEFRVKHPKRVCTDEEVEQAWWDVFPKREPTEYPKWAMPLPRLTRAFYMRVL